MNRAIPVCSLLIMLCGCPGVRHRLSLRQHRWELNQSSHTVKDFDIKFIRVEPGGAVVIEHKGKQYSAAVGERFAAPGLLGLVSVETSDRLAQSATIGGKWCDSERVFVLW